MDGLFQHGTPDSRICSHMNEYPRLCGQLQSSGNIGSLIGWTSSHRICCAGKLTGRRNALLNDVYIAPYLPITLYLINYILHENKLLSILQNS